MKSVGKLSTVVLAALLCFPSSALAQTSAKAHAGNGISSVTPSAFFTFTMAIDQKGHDHDGGGNGCKKDGGGDKADGWGGDKGGNGGGGCSTVPEGGSALTYLSLAGLCCLGVAFFKSRRSATSEIKN
jgi:hypothetical protein